MFILRCMNYVYHSMGARILLRSVTELLHAPENAALSPSDYQTNVIGGDVQKCFV